MNEQNQRDDLLERAKVGEITGEQADAEAIRLGLGSLSRRPDAGQFQPETETHWTLPMAVAWVAYLDLDEVREWSAPFRAECYDWFWQRWRRGFDGPIYEGWHLEQRSKPTLGLLGISSAFDRAEGDKALAMTIGEAREALWTALREGFFVATGIDTETYRRVEIAALDWHELIAVEGRGEVDEVRRGPMARAIEDILLPAVALRGFWRKPVENVERLPPTMCPNGDGFMPLYCAAQWIATEGGVLHFPPNDPPPALARSLCRTPGSDHVGQGSGGRHAVRRTRGGCRAHLRWHSGRLSIRRRRTRPNGWSGTLPAGATHISMRSTGEAVSTTH